MLREGPLITAYHMGPLRIATKNLPGGKKNKNRFDRLKYQSHCWNAV